MNKNLLTFFTILIFIVITVSLLTTSSVSHASVSTNPLQTSIELTPIIDTYVASGPDVQNDPRGNRSGLFVGYDDDPDFDLQKTRTFLRFDLTALENKKIIEDATLRLYVTFVTFEFPDQTMNIEIHKVTEDFNNEVTWNNQPLYDQAVMTSKQVDTQYKQWIEWQIPQHVIQDSINSSTQHLDLALLSPDGEIEGKHLRNFFSKEYENGRFAPQLIVSYTEPVTVTSTPTNTPTPTATNTPTNTPTPTPYLSLNVDHNPPDNITWGDKITYTIAYSNTNKTNIPLTNAIITGSIPSHTTLLGNPSGKPEIKANQIIWSIEKLQPSDGGEFTYIVKVDNAAPTNTLTATPTSTLTPTLTATSIGTLTVIPTDTLTATPTDTLTTTPTGTLTVIPTHTLTSTPAGTLTVIPTDTLTATPTDTLTTTPIGTLTLIPTDTLTPTPAGTLTLIPTDTLTPTPAGTLTVIPTDTLTPTPTGTLTATPTNSFTATPIPTPTVGLTSPVITNCVEANSNETSPITICAYNGGTKLWLPIILNVD